MVAITGGCFQMGSPADEAGREDDEQQHQVCVGDFAIGQYEVTFDEYDQFARVTRRGVPSDEGWGRGRRPVINVSWSDTVAYTTWLSERTGHTYRLPTEAEWEYAARAGTTTRWSFGDDEKKLGDYAWYSANADDKTHPVGKKQANPWGLYDMYGNVWEWVQDCYHNYKDAPKDGRVRESDECTSRVGRGGSFDASPVDLLSAVWDFSPENLRSASRDGGDPVYRFRHIGFRCVRVPPVLSR